MQDNLDREKKVRADVEKAKRKLEQDLRQTQEAVEELERVKSELEDAGRKSVDVLLTSWIQVSWLCWRINVTPENAFLLGSTFTKLHQS